MNMTNEKAIDLLRRIQEPEAYEPQITEEAFEALELAIRALGTDKNVGTKDVPDTNVGDKIFIQSTIEAIRAALLSWSYMPEWRDTKIIEAVKRLQPAQAMSGKWIRTGSGSLFDHYECSVCGKLPKWECLGDNRWRIAFTEFCPNCGAKMEGTA